MEKWQVEFTKRADKQFGKLDRTTQQQIVQFLDKLIDVNDPTTFGKALVGEFSGLWRYRVGKYRLICKFEHQKLVIEIISIGKRDKVYR